MATIDLTGQQFGRWKVIKRVENNKRGDAQWLCQCNCEQRTVRPVLSKSLRNGTSKSCGCLTVEASKSRAKHRSSDTRLYKIWRGMKSRCYNKNSNYYNNYGGRGITVCQEWVDDFPSFMEWSINNGYKDNLTIDRIENSQGYSPNNCRWATRREQSNNLRKNIILEFKNKEHTIAEWARILNISYIGLYHRIERGWTIERALTTPIAKPQTK